MGRKLGGGCAPLREVELGPHLTQRGQAEAYLHAKFHLDPSNRLATIHQRYRQTGQTTDRWHRANCFTNGRPNSVLMILRSRSLYSSVCAFNIFSATRHRQMMPSQNVQLQNAVKFVVFVGRCDAPINVQFGTQKIVSSLLHISAVR